MKLVDKLFGAFKKSTQPTKVIFKVPSAEDIGAAKQMVDEIICAGLSNANRSGKKLLIVVSDVHFADPTFIALQLITLDVAKKYGVQNAAYEMKPGDPEAIKKIDINTRVVVPFFISASYAQEILDMEVSPIDKPGLDHKYCATQAGITERESYMFEMLNAIDDHAIVFTGTMHLPAFMRSQELIEKFTPIAFHVLGNKEPAHDDLEPWRRSDLLESASINRIDFQGDVRELQFWDIIAFSTNQHSADKLKNIYLERGSILSDDESRAIEEAATADIQGDPDHLTGYSARSYVRSQLNDHEGAWSDHVHIIRCTIKTHGIDSKEFIDAALRFTNFKDSLPPSVRANLAEKVKKGEIPSSYLPALNL